MHFGSIAKIERSFNMAKEPVAAVNTDAERFLKDWQPSPNIRARVNGAGRGLHVLTDKPCISAALNPALCDSM